MIERALPLSEQVRIQLLEWIRTEKLIQADGALPSEAEIAERLAVSRATVRDALSRLERDRIIIRRHGSGTYVHPTFKKFTAGIDTLRDPAALVEADGYTATIGFQEIKPAALSAQAAEALGTVPDHPALEISVLYLADARPAVWLEGFLPVNDASRTSQPSYRTLPQFVRQMTGVDITHSIATIEVALADKALAQRLGRKPGQPLFSLVDTYLTDDSDPVFYSRTCFVPGIVRLQMLRRSDGRSGRLSVW